LEQGRAYWHPQLEGGVISFEAAMARIHNNYMPRVSGGFQVSKDLLAGSVNQVQGSSFISLQQQILNLSQRKTKHATHANIKASQCLLEAQLFEIDQTIISLFRAALSAQDEIKVTKERKVLTQKALSIIEETVSLKLVASSDLDLAKSDLKQTQIDAAQSNASYVQALDQLKTNLGLRSDQSLKLPADMNLSPNSIKGWQTWVNVQPDVLGLKHQVQASQLDIDALKWERLPTVDVNAGYSHPTLNPGGASDALNLSSSLNVPIFDGGNRKVNIKESQKKLSIDQLALKHQTLRKQNELHAILVELQANQKTLKLTQAQQLDAQRAYDGALALFSVGRNNYFNLQNAQNQIISAQRQALSTQRQIQAIRATLALWQAYADPQKETKNTQCESDE